MHTLAMGELMDLTPGLYRGTVTGEESGHCVCRLEVRRLTQHALSVDYEAVGSDDLQHVEHTIITNSALHVATSEFPNVVAFRSVARGVYVTDTPAHMEIHADFEDDTLTWCWHWAAPGETAREKSRATAEVVR